MHRLNVTLPNDVHTQLKRLAKVEGIPVKRYVAIALTRHIELVEAGIPAVNDALSNPAPVDEVDKQAENAELVEALSDAIAH